MSTPCEKCGGSGEEPYDLLVDSVNPWIPMVVCSACDGSGTEPEVVGQEVVLEEPAPELTEQEVQALIIADLAGAMQNIYMHEMVQSHPYGERTKELARAALIAVGLCPHHWQPKEARARLDSRSYNLKGMKYTWQCEYCGETRSSTSPDGPELEPPPDYIDVEPK